MPAAACASSPAGLEASERASSSSASESVGVIEMGGVEEPLECLDARRTALASPTVVAPTSALGSSGDGRLAASSAA